MTAIHSRTPRGLPGRLTMSVRPRIPAIARETIASGDDAAVATRAASGMPGTWRSITRRVASGVTSRGATPLPPVVSTRSTFSVSAISASVLAIISRSSGTTTWAMTSPPSAPTVWARYCPLSFFPWPRLTRSLAVRMPQRTPLSRGSALIGGGPPRGGVAWKLRGGRTRRFSRRTCARAGCFRSGCRVPPPSACRRP